MKQQVEIDRIIKKYGQVPRDDFEYSDPDEDNFFKYYRQYVPSIIFHGRETFLQRPGNFSNLGCPHCFAPIPADTPLIDGKYKCTKCGENCKRDWMMVSMRRDMFKFFDQNAVKKNHWFHFTYEQDWDEMISGNRDDLHMIHLGTKAAALDRHRQKLDAQERPPVLYEIELDKNCKIAPDFWEDDNFDGKNESLLVKKVENGNIPGVFNGATRYLNLFESPGSVSLCVNPHLVHIVGKTDLTKL